MTLDINCDLGEGTNNEHLLMPLITSCNIACGGHYGNVNTVDSTLDLAIKNRVKIGAHPSFPDLENFGRKKIELSENELADSLQEQLSFFTDRLQRKNQVLHHIKPHGALYHEVAKNEKVAKLFVNSLKSYLQDALLFLPYDSEIEKVAKANNINFQYEVFADRNYNNDLSLVSRQSDHAMLIDKEKVEQHILSMIQNNKVQTISGEQLDIKVDTLSIHSDTKNAHQILSHVVAILIKNGLYVK